MCKQGRLVKLQLPKAAVDGVCKFRLAVKLTNGHDKCLVRFS